MNVQAVDSRIAAIFDRPGPFVTAYLDATRSTENGPHEIDVRWRDLRKQLEEDGADSASLDAIEARVAADAGTPGPHGLVLVAAGGALVHSDRLHSPRPAAPAGCRPFPHLLPYLAQRATDVPHIVVVADRTGADLLAVSAGGAAEERSVEGDGSTRSTAPGGTSGPSGTSRTGSRTPGSRTRRTSRPRSPASSARGRPAWSSCRRRPCPQPDRRRPERGPGCRRHRALHRRGRSRRRLVGRRARAGRPRSGPARGVAAAPRGARTPPAEPGTAGVCRGRSGRGGRRPADGPGGHGRAVRRPSSTLRAWIGPQATEFGLDDADAAALGLDPVEHDRYDAALVRAVVGTGREVARHARCARVRGRRHRRAAALRHADQPHCARSAQSRPGRNCCTFCLTPCLTTSPGVLVAVQHGAGQRLGPARRSRAAGSAGRSGRSGRRAPPAGRPPAPRPTPARSRRACRC